VCFEPLSQLPKPEYIELFPWWVHTILVPVVFVLLGAFVGFVTTLARDRIDRRRVRRAFLRATRRELITLERQLSTAIEEVESGEKRLIDNRQLPAFALSFRTTVYASQLSKLSDVANPLVLTVIEVYSDITALEGIVRILNEQSSQAETLRPQKQIGIVQQANEAAAFLRAVSKVGSACQVLLERLRLLLPAVKSLVEKLPE